MVQIQSDIDRYGGKSLFYSSQPCLSLLKLIYEAAPGINGYKIGISKSTSMVLHLEQKLQLLDLLTPVHSQW